MNSVARVFVVLNLILAAGFLLAAGTFLHQNENFKGQLTSEKQKHSEVISTLTAEKQGIQDDLNRVQNDLNRTKGTVTTLESEKSSMTTRLEGEQRERRNVESTLKTLQDTHSATTTQIGELRNELKSLREQVDTYRNASLADRDRALEALSETAAAISARDDFEAQLNAITDQRGVLMKEFEALSQEHAKWVGAYPPPPAGDAPKIDGQVLRYDAATNLVEINRGSSNGIKIGHEYDVVRGAEFICTIRIDRVEDARSVGSIDVRMPGRQPRSGDRATKL